MNMASPLAGVLIALSLLSCYVVAAPGTYVAAYPHSLVPAFGCCTNVAVYVHVLHRCSCGTSMSPYCVVHTHTRTHTHTHTPVPVYIGCYIDKFAAADRDLASSLFLEELMTPEVCEAKCGGAGYKYAGSVHNSCARAHAQTDALMHIACIAHENRSCFDASHARMCVQCPVRE